jgi:predicted nuclease of predicted toxin-antitoxin system
MKLLLDQGLPRSTAKLLRDAGRDAVHVGDVQLADAEDQQILDKANEQARIVITLDADFHTLLALGGHTGPSVIRIRIEGLKGEPLANLIQEVLNKVQADLAAGALVTVQPGRIRVRKLPIWKVVPAPEESGPP